VQQADMFAIIGCSRQELEHILGSYCPTTLFPCARETVANLIARAGFPPLNLAPINFDILLAQRKDMAEKFGSIPPVTRRVVAR
jgi:preprotein translocase subunit SecB